ncbi:uncharacterized protein LOC114867192 isoform X2 [Betta splendens]|uniref:Uncharacterized protein LOC114867192 isoform X2 n=1 Tax=Betta splendens TaxID=158456 RepID=A0A9W2XMJ9_BETSP|nr:uncharacterized protein LOC114867192 isoform X2 [Betta splendens]
MGHTFLCELQFLLLIRLFWCGHAEDAVLTLEPNWTRFVPGESVTFTCDMKEGENTDWEIRFTKDGQKFVRDSSAPTLTIKKLFTRHSGKYQCSGLHKTKKHMKISKSISLIVSDKKENPKARLTAGPSTISVGGSVTLSCSVDDSDGWKYDWFRRTSNTYVTPAADGDNREIRVTQGGVYTCKGGRGEPAAYSDQSDDVTIKITYSNSVSVSLQLDWTQVIRGQITVRCEIQGGGDTQWVYDWKTTSGQTITQRTDTNYWTVSAFSSGGYRCRGTNRQDSDSSTRWSEAAALTVSGAVLTLDPSRSRYFTGESVTFTCDMKDDKRTDWETRLIKDGGEIASYNRYRIKALSTGDSGRYQCFSVHRKTNHIKTSETTNLTVSVPNKVVVTLHPNWTQLFSGETITVRCEIEDRGDTEWEYEWKTPRSINPSDQHEHTITVGSSDSGGYSCKGRMKREQQSSTVWSDAVTLRVSDNKAQCVLTASPSWLSPGASVALSCEVEPPSAGWRFYWYQTVPDGSHSSYRYELLPGSEHGTEQGSYMLDGHTHTAGYVCRAARGEPVYYTDYSKAAFVWSGDVDPSASLTVSPDTVQHFTRDSVSLSCEGNSTEWRVRRFPEGGFLSSCSNWTTSGSRCDINTSQSGSAVFWCESGSGHFSNSVNVTVHDGDIVLVSPVLPVTQGTAVTLGCRSRTQHVVSNVSFYNNDQLIQSDTRAELNISAASESHQGFYSCQVKEPSRTLTSAQSWMSVTLSSSDSFSLPVLLIAVLVCGFTLMLLLLFCLYKKSKARSTRSRRTNQSSATDHMTHQDGRNDDPLLHDASRELTYSEIKFKNIRKNKQREAEDASVYAHVRTGSAAEH